MTIRQLEILTAIAETGRFRRAAERLFLTQPSVSQQIQLLEEELGEKLFIRSRARELQLTEAGRILQEYANAVLRQCEMAKVEVGSLSSEPIGTVRIGSVSSSTSVMLGSPETVPFFDAAGDRRSNCSRNCATPGVAVAGGIWSAITTSE